MQSADESVPFKDHNIQPHGGLVETAVPVEHEQTIEGAPRRGRNPQQKPNNKQRPNNSKRQQQQQQQQAKQRADASPMAASAAPAEDKTPAHGMLVVPAHRVKHDLQRSWNGLAQSGAVAIDPSTTFLLDLITACPSRFRIGELTRLFDALDDESPAKMRVAGQFVSESNVSAEVAGWIGDRVLHIENSRAHRKSSTGTADVVTVDVESD